MVADDPLEEVSHLRNLEMVFKNGKPVDIEPPQGLTDYWSLFMQLNS